MFASKGRDDKQHEKSNQSFIHWTEIQSLSSSSSSSSSSIASNKSCFGVAKRRAEKLLFSGFLFSASIHSILEIEWRR